MISITKYIEENMSEEQELTPEEIDQKKKEDPSWFQKQGKKVKSFAKGAGEFASQVAAPVIGSAANVARLTGRNALAGKLYMAKLAGDLYRSVS